MNGARPERYRIQDLVVDVEDAEVRRGDERIALPPRTFALLLLLARRYPHLVRRGEILDVVWPDEHVTDQTLTHRILLLRHALGDVADSPRYVAGERGWGYRMLGPVERTGVQGAPVTARRERWIIGGVGVGLLLAALGGGPHVIRSEPFSAHTVAVRPLATTGLPEPMRSVADDLAANLRARLGRIDGVHLVEWQESGRPALWFEGAIGTDDDRLEIELRLEEAARGTVWQKRLSGRAYDVLPVESALVEEAAANVSAWFGVAPRRAAARPDARLERLCLRGEFHWLSWSPEGLESARAAFGRARDLDPGFAPAHAGLALVEALSTFLGQAPHRTAGPRAREELREARRLDSGEPLTLAAAGFVRLLVELDPAGAEKELQRAVWIAPDAIPARMGLALTLTARGRFAASLTALPATFALEPDSGLHLLRGRSLQLSGRFETAAESYRRALASSPRLFAARLGLAECEMARGRTRAVIEALWPEPPRPRAVDDAWSRLCHDGGLPVGARLRSCLHSGEADEARELLRLGVAQRWPFVVFVAADPTMAVLTRQPDVQGMLADLTVTAGS